MQSTGRKTKVIDYDCELDLEAIERRIAGAKFVCIKEYPFYASLLMVLQVRCVDKDHWIKTMAVNDTTLFFNPHFVNALDREELLFVMAHEVLHLVLKHLSRRGSREAALWNSAGDYVINAMLVASGVGKFPAIGGLYDQSYLDLSTDKVYSMLYERKDKNPDSGNGDGDGGNFDQHMEVVEGSSTEDNSDGSKQTTTMSAADMDEMESDMDSRLINAVTMAKNADKAGQIPAGIRRMVEDLTTARVNWRRLVAECATSQIKSDYTRSRPNKKMMALGVYLPTLHTESHFEFTIGIDTSGSISVEMLTNFVSEIYHISRSFKSFNIKVFQYDTRVYGERDFTQDNIEEMLSYEIKGGGGTCFDAAYEYMKKINHVPKTYINFTDGQPYSSWGDADYCKTVFIIHDKYTIDRRVVAPFGVTTYYSEE